MTTVYSNISASADLAAAEDTLKANIGLLRHCRAEPSTTQIAAVAAVEHIIVTATKQQVGWAKLRLIALRALGIFLLQTPRLGRGRPKKDQHGLLPCLADLGIKDNHIATRALNVAKISEELFNAYLTNDEPTEGGLLALRATSDSEWYTPERVFTALGCRFDLDVASPGADIVPRLPADRHFTLADNGLERDWGDAYVWMNAPHGRGTLPKWLEKFQKHANGIALVVDRTSAGWWQDLCGNADLILHVNKKIDFLRPDNEPGTNALGSTLVAYGERGVQALRNAAAAGLGILFKPCQPVGEPEPETRRAQNYSKSNKQFWLTPPERLAELRAEFGDNIWDATPFPRPAGFNSLEMEWPALTYINGPFSARHNPEGHGPTDYARKAIEEHKRGKTSIMVAPIFNYIDILMRAGAELRPWGRVPWLDAITGEPHPSPPFIGCFILRGKQCKKS
jgi:DNA N-6-adenine-methyltransferase (Dam)